MKSVYNKIARFQPTNTSLNLENLLNVNITTILNNQALVYNSINSKWENKSIPISIASCTDANIISPQNNQILTYDTGFWKNLNYYGIYNNLIDVANSTIIPTYNNIYFSNLGVFNMPNSIKGACIKIVNFGGTLCTINFTSKILWHVTNLFNVTLTSNEAAEIEFIGLGGNAWQLKNMTGKWNNSLNTDKLTISNVKFSDLSDVFVPGVTNGKILRYNGGLSYWNATDETINSVFGRTGTIVSQNNDYVITQIQNSSILANSANINITSPQFNNFLYYNGAQWANTEISAYIGRLQPVINTTMVLQNIYASGVNNQLFTLPTCGAGDVGRRILLTAASLNQTSLVVPNLIFLNGSTNFTSSSSIGSIEIIVSGGNQYQIIAVYGNWLNSVNLKKFAPTELSSLYDCIITAPANNDALLYNGGNWINSNININTNKFISGNSSGALSNNQYFRLNSNGMEGNEFRGIWLASANIIIRQIYAHLSVAPGVGNSRVFTVRVNNANTALVLTIADTNISGNASVNISINPGDRITVLHTSIGAAGSEGIINLRIT